MTAMGQLESFTTSVNRPQAACGVRLGNLGKLTIFTRRYLLNHSGG